MHRPPAVTHHVDRSRGCAVLFAALSLMGIAANAWLISSFATVAQGLLCSSVTFAAVGLAFWSWKTSPIGRLQWDGQHWHWSEFLDVPVQRVTLVLDFQRLILVKILNGRGLTRWVWLESRSPDAHWLAVRRAVVASGRIQAKVDSDGHAAMG